MGGRKGKRNELQNNVPKFGRKEKKKLREVRQGRQEVMGAKGSRPSDISQCRGVV